MSLASRLIPAIEQPSLRVLLVRLGILLTVSASCLLVWWSISRRLLPASQLVREKTMAMARLANEVQRLEFNWNPVEAAQTEAQFSQARARLFTNSEALQNWQREAEREADALALQPISRTGKMRVHPAGRQDLTLVPVTVDIRPLEVEGATNSAYSRLLQFSRILQNPEKRLDLVELSISGGSNSIQQVRMLLNVWAPEQVQP